MNKNIPYPSDSAIVQFLRGEGELKKRHAEREEVKKGILRVGSSGCVINSNEVVGADPHETLARFLGYQLPTTASQAYFDGGLDNESMWDVNIRASGADFLSEEEIPVKYQLEDGTLITGRPDLVVGHFDDAKVFTPKHIYELKSAQATKSAASKLLIGHADHKHVIQAATYAMFLNCPASVVYTVNVSGVIGNGGRNDFFAQRDAGRKTVPFGKAEYPVSWVDGTLFFKEQGEDLETAVTQEGILDFYRGIVQMAKTKDLSLLRGSRRDIFGDMIKYYDPNDYKTFNLCCDNTLPFDEWLKIVKFVCSQDKVIKFEKKGADKHFTVYKPDFFFDESRYYAEPQIVETFASLEAAREFLLQEMT